MHDRPKMGENESYRDFVKRSNFPLWNQTFNDSDGMEIYDVIMEQVKEDFTGLSYESFEASIPEMGTEYIKAMGDGNHTRAMIAAITSHIINELNEDHFRTYNNKSN